MNDESAWNSAPNCIFCKIISLKAPARIHYQDHFITVFDTIHPIAPLHLLLVPNKHITSVNDTLPEDEQMLGKLFTTAAGMAAKYDVSAYGYRLVINTGRGGGQSVFHLHMHLLAKRHLKMGVDL